MKLRNLIASSSHFCKRLCSTVVSPAPASTVEASVSIPAAVVNGVEGSVSSPQTATSKGLSKKLSKLIAKGSTMTQTLNQLSMKGFTFRESELSRCAKDLRRFRDHQHALEIFDWMEMRKMNLSVSDHAIRLDLIAKTNGLEAAESYLESLDSSMKNHRSIYSSLMNCYCEELEEEKAKAHFERMDELGYVSDSVPFNQMMSMYMELDQPEKVLVLVDAMIQRGISPCWITYSLWMKSCCSLGDLDRLEKIIDVMGKDSEAKISWNTFYNLAAIYAKAGLYDKADTALKSVEKRMNANNRDAYHSLMSLYAEISKGPDVYRAWESLSKARPEVNSSSYIVMLQALSKLGDIDGIKKIFTEWESKCLIYDMRLSNMVINEYLKRNVYEEAEAILNRAMEKCKGPFTYARELLMTHLLENSKTDLAMKHLEAAISDSEDKCSLSSELVNLLFHHFEKAKDVDRAEEFCRILSNWRPLDSETATFLIKIYAAAGKTCPVMRERLSRHQIEVNEEIQDLLETVCPLVHQSEFF